MFPPSAPLAQLKAWFKSRRADGGVCPVCEQHFKVYRRKLNTGMARSLIAMYKAGRTSYIHLPTTIGARSREEGKLRYWGLVEEQNPGSHDGYWRVTEMGERFILRKLEVPQYAEVYNGDRLALTGDLISITDALGAPFDYIELMSERPMSA